MILIEDQDALGNPFQPHDASGNDAGGLRLPTQRGTLAEDSIPLWEKIKGDKAYKARLESAALELYHILRKDPLIRSNYEKPVYLKGKDRGKLAAFNPRGKAETVHALKHVLHSCAYIASRPTERDGGGLQINKYVGVPMNSNDFSPGAQYAHLSGNGFRRAVLALALYGSEDGANGWLDYYPGTNSKEAEIGLRTRIQPTGEFLDWMMEKGLIFQGHPVPPEHGPSKGDESVLWLKYEDHRGKKMIETLDRPLLGDEMILPELNRRLGDARVTCSFPNYQEYDDNWDFNGGKPKSSCSGSTQLFRQFTPADGKGGRLWGHWGQNFRSDLRPYLTINRSPTTELDYRSMQLVLLYAIAGVPVPDMEDLYTIPGTRWSGKLLRKHMKTVLKVSVGNATRAETIRSISQELRESNSNRDGKAAELYDAFWQFHHAVCPHDTGAPVVAHDLQYAESQITLRVLRYLMGQRILAIPIHDSFIVQARYREKLRAAMTRGFHDYWPDTQVVIKRTY